MLKAQRGKVAVSGYPGEWDHLDWQQTEREALAFGNGHAGEVESRTKVLWTNYDAGDVANIPGGLFAQPA